MPDARWTMLMSKTIYTLVRLLCELVLWASPVPTGVLNHNVVIFIDATDCSSGGEGLEHSVSPPTVAMLEGLDDL